MKRFLKLLFALISATCVIFFVSGLRDPAILAGTVAAVCLLSVSAPTILDSAETLSVWIQAAAVIVWAIFLIGGIVLIIFARIIDPDGVDILRFIGYVLMVWDAAIFIYAITPPSRQDSQAVASE